MTNSTTNSQPNAFPESRNSSQRPSVPISVYRELSAELQATQVQLDSLYEKNQKLERYNKQLRQEIANVLASTQHMEQVIRVMDGGEKAKLPAQIEQPAPPPAPEVSSTVQPSQLEEKKPEQLVTEVKPPTQDPTAEESTKEVNSWLLWVLVFLLALTAFGTGFLVVRPLLSNNQQN